jgi:hypothetical protein
MERLTAQDWEELVGTHQEAICKMSDPEESEYLDGEVLEVRERDNCYQVDVKSSATGLVYTVDMIDGKPELCYLADSELPFEVFPTKG